MLPQKEEMSADDTSAVLALLKSLVPAIEDALSQFIGKEGVIVRVSSILRSFPARLAQVGWSGRSGVVGGRITVKP
jgi:hypothetical protein